MSRECISHVHSNAIVSTVRGTFAVITHSHSRRTCVITKILLVHTPKQELKDVCDCAGCDLRFAYPYELELHKLRHEWEEEAEKNKPEVADENPLGLNRDPCYTWKKDIKKLRVAERNHIPVFEMEERIPREFSSEMMVQVRRYNEAMTGKECIAVDFFSTLT